MLAHLSRRCDALQSPGGVQNGNREYEHEEEHGRPDGSANPGAFAPAVGSFLLSAHIFSSRTFSHDDLSVLNFNILGRRHARLIKPLEDAFKAPLNTVLTFSLRTFKLSCSAK